MPDDFRPVYHPAGHDAALRGALEEVQAGRWMALRDLLAQCGSDWSLRTARSQVLATAAARSNVVQVWREEEPASVDVLMMQARIAVERALQAHRRGALGGMPVDDLVLRAREACWLAGNAMPADPVPWVCLLALAQLDVERRQPEHRQPGPDPMLASGPWGLLAEAHQRDPGNREAFHRMLQALSARAQGEAIDYVRWVVSWAPGGSPLLVLPLYAYAEQYRRLRDAGRLDPLARRQWMREHIAHDVDRALCHWFAVTPADQRGLLDLSHLAHGLWAATRFQDASPVFEALGPYATRLPWAHTADDPASAEREFLWARDQCRAAARGRSPT